MSWLEQQSLVPKFSLMSWAMTWIGSNPTTPDLMKDLLTKPASGWKLQLLLDVHKGLETPRGFGMFGNLYSS